MRGSPRGAAAAKGGALPGAGLRLRAGVAGAPGPLTCRISGARSGEAAPPGQRDRARSQLKEGAA